MPDVMALGGGVFERCIGHEGGALMNGFIKGVPGSLLASSTLWTHSGKAVAMNQEDGPWF